MESSDRRRRLKWDARFLRMAKEVSTWSRDPSTQVGAVIVRPDMTVASVGYNGFPRGMDDSPELYLNRETKNPRTVHAEMNAVLTARERLDGYAIYVHPFMSCERCAVHLIQTGIKRVVSPICPEHLVERWGHRFAESRKYLEGVGIEVTEY